jgi:hypothetical protein
VDELVQRALAKKFPVVPDENAQALRLINQWTAQAPTDPDQVQVIEAKEDLGQLSALREPDARRSRGAALV